MRKIRFILFLFMILCSGILYAQDTGKVEMADKMMADGKIYVVVSVVLIILAGLLTYLIRIDRKVSKMEKNIEAEKKENK